MSIDQQISRAAVTGQVNLTDPLRRNSRKIFHRREAVIDRVDVNVVYVQQNSAIGFLSDRGNETPIPASTKSNR